MPSPPTQRIPPDTLRRSPRGSTAFLLPWAPACYRRGLAITAAAAALSLVAVLSSFSPGWCQWIHGGFVVLAAATALLGAARRLPIQNVVVAGLMIGATSLVILVAIQSPDLIAEPDDGSSLGPWILGRLPWQVPLWWMALLFSSRETARLLLRPWRRNRHYGYWLIAIAAALATLADAAFQPFGLHAAQWWEWKGRTPRLAWHGYPAPAFLATFACSAVLLAFVTPWLIRKRPLAPSPTWDSAALWILLNLYLLIGNAARGLLAPAALTLLAIAAIAALGWRNSTASVSPPTVPAPDAPVEAG
ncbi:MAG TPA: carotenoid biosynthesis protein [Verrucomicrobiota bacterium]|nr:carotenoid biosynthesis protein [Verrucomicrobiota bacterium]HNU50095.1 carotenoid biosynthesis protein [Verrucomicrobiota bacterium]